MSSEIVPITEFDIDKYIIRYTEFCAKYHGEDEQLIVLRNELREEGTKLAGLANTYLGTVYWGSDGNAAKDAYEAQRAIYKEVENKYNLYQGGWVGMFKTIDKLAIEEYEEENEEEKAALLREAFYVPSLDELHQIDRLRKIDLENQIEEIHDKISISVLEELPILEMSLEKVLDKPLTYRHYFQEGYMIFNFDLIKFFQDASQIDFAKYLKRKIEDLKGSFDEAENYSTETQPRKKILTRKLISAKEKLILLGYLGFFDAFPFGEEKKIGKQRKVLTQILGVSDHTIRKYYDTHNPRFWEDKEIRISDHQELFEYLRDEWGIGPLS